MSTRTQILTATMVATIVLAIGAATIPGIVHRYVLRLGATDIHDSSALPDVISVCGRDYRRDATNRRFPLHGTLIDPLPFPPCPDGPCHPQAGGPCDTVVFVRVGADEYVDYALDGGP